MSIIIVLREIIRRFEEEASWGRRNLVLHVLARNGLFRFHVEGKGSYVLIVVLEAIILKEGYVKDIHLVVVIGYIKSFKCEGSIELVIKYF